MAQADIYLTTKIDDEGINKGVNSINGAMGRLKKTAQEVGTKMSSAFSSGASEMETMKNRSDVATASLEKQAVKVKQLKDYLDDLEAGTASIGSRKLSEIDREISGVSRESARAQKEVDKLTAKMKSLEEQAFKTSGKTITQKVYGFAKGDKEVYDKAVEAKKALQVELAKEEAIQQRIAELQNKNLSFDLRRKVAMKEAERTKAEYKDPLGADEAKAYKANKAEILKLTGGADNAKERIAVINSELEKTNSVLKEIESRKVVTGEKKVTLPAETTIPQEKEYNKMKARVEQLNKDIATNKRTTSRLEEQRNAVAEAERQRLIDKTTAKLEYERKTMNKLQSKVKTANDNMNKSFLLGAKGVKHMTKRIIGLARRVLIFSVVAIALNRFKETLMSVLKSDTEFGKSLEQLQTALWTAFVPIYEFILPAFKTLVQWTTAVIMTLLRFYSLLSGRSLQSLIEKGQQLRKNSKDYDKNSKAIKKNTKEMKDNLAQFDKINVLQKDEPESAGGGGGVTPNTDVLKDTVSDSLAKVAMILGGALFVLGTILVCMGQIPTGLGLMVAGAGLFTAGTTVAINDSALSDSVKTALAKIVPILSTFLAVLGVILLATGHIPLGLGFLIAGVALFAGVTKATLNSDKTKQTVKDALGKVVAVVTPVIAILGVILLCTGHFAIGAGLLLAGIGMFAFTYANANDETRDIIKQKLAEITNIIGHALVVLGVILLLTGHFGLGLGALLLGITAVGVSSVNFDGEKIKNFVENTLEDILATIRRIVNRIVDVIKHPAEYIMWIFQLLKAFVGSVWNGILQDAGRTVNKMIRMLNKLPKVNIPYVTWGQEYISVPPIPALAKGAVISGGKPFLAMLGDQPSGQTNVEAPLSTIQEAVLNAMREQKQAQPLILELDGRELGRAVLDTSQRELGRVGVNMIVGA